MQADDLACLSRTACGKVLGLSRQQFHSFVDNYVEYLSVGDEKTVGRPRLITEEESKEIISEIRRRQLALQPMTITNICNFIFDKFQKACSRRFVRDWISRHKRDVMIQFVKPAEQARATVKHEDLRQFYTQLPELLKDTVPELIYNVDETGFSRRCSATKLRAVLCTDSQPEKAVYVQKPDENTLTLLACVSLAGKHLRPYVIVPTKSINKEILSFVNVRIRPFFSRISPVRSVSERFSHVPAFDQCFVPLPHVEGHKTCVMARIDLFSNNLPLVSALPNKYQEVIVYSLFEVRVWRIHYVIGHIRNLMRRYELTYRSTTHRHNHFAPPPEIHD